MILKLRCNGGLSVTYKDMSVEDTEENNPSTYKIFGDAVVVINADGDKLHYPLNNIIEITETK